MRRTNNYRDIFSIYLKSIDLHGETRDIARVMTIDFLRENIHNKDKKVVIIHGIGTGAVKDEVHKILKKNSHICKYYIQNSGSTLVEYIADGIIKK